MKNESENWMEDVFQSMKGHSRAKPDSAILARVEAAVANSPTKVIPLSQWRYAAAAAALVLLLNVAGILYYNQSMNLSGENTAVADTYGQSLISSYQIYK